MRIPLRIAAPVLVALLCAAAIGGVLWWELYRSSNWLLEQTGDEIVNGTGTVLAPITAGIDPRDRALLELRHGDIAALRGDWTEAEARYAASAQQGGGVPALRKLAQAQLQLREYDDVRNTVRRLRQEGGSADDALLIESIVELRLGERQAARTQLEAAADSPHKHYGLALLAIVEGNHEIARQELQQVIQSWEPVLRAHARTLDAAYEEYALFPASPGTHLVTLVSRSLAQVQQCELALPLLARVTSQSGDYRDAWIVQGYCELTTGRHQPALLSLERAYNLDPQKPETQYFLGRAYLASGDPQSALTFLEYALANGFQPEQDVRLEIAHTALQLDEPALARQQYEAMLQSPEPPLSAYEGFVTTSLLFGDTDAAYARAQEAVQRFPRDAGALTLLGQSAAALGREGEARDALRQALEIDPLNETAKELQRELE